MRRERRPRCDVTVDAVRRDDGGRVVVILSRAEHVLQRGIEAGVDAVLVWSQPNVAYLTGFTGSAGYAFVSRGGTILLTDSRYGVQAPLEASGCDVRVMTGRGYRPGGEAFNRALAELVGETGASVVGLESDRVVVAEWLAMQGASPGVEFRPLASVVEAVRMVKEAQELTRLRAAAALADEAFAHIVDFIRPGIAETEVALELEIFMRRRGASGTAFDTIVASGERSAMPHGTASARQIGTGEFVVLDFGAVLDGYRSDMTRTVCVGQPTARMRDLYAVVYEAHLQGAAAVRGGAAAAAVDDAARSVIAAAGHGAAFGHALGHGLGLETHEGPRLAPDSRDVLQEGMVVTIEPGVYLEGFAGVRIEDAVIVNADGCESIARSGKELITL